MRSALADLLSIEERFDEAEVMLKQVLSIQTAVYGPDDIITLHTVFTITIISIIIT
jgi:2-phospho-L-lactate guanylyltransferase (CobY/MobA/RfbA family)